MISLMKPIIVSVSHHSSGGINAPASFHYFWPHSERHNHILFLLCFTGFLQPTLLVSLLHQMDFEGFGDCHWAFLCPLRGMVLYDELVYPEDPLDLAKVLLAIHDHNKEAMLYFGSDGAEESYRQFYNDAEIRMKQVSQAH